MNKQSVEELWGEMASHLQAALAWIELLLLDGPNEALIAAQGDIMAAWLAFKVTAEPVLLGPSENGQGRDA